MEVPSHVAQIDAEQNRRHLKRQGRLARFREDVGLGRGRRHPEASSDIASPEAGPAIESADQPLRIAAGLSRTKH